MNELDIFSAALDLTDPAERSCFLDEACGDSSELRHRIEALLSNAARASQFLEAPAPEFQATLDQPITEKPGTQIGPYKLLQQLGEGGMGVVYMAEQKEPVKRRVALKIIKPGMDTRQVIARFEAERQALAMMDHPNIAKVLDAGATESGRPYFVMELVNGLPVTGYCDEQHLTPKERLELFVPICQAVQHAHQKGIIHRDLKPSNILVAMYDNKAVPKIIDFGVAKATSQTLTEKTMFTQLGQVVGTLEYMSPEQAQRNQLDIDTRSDVYSLGVVLYELLTGETPFDRARLRSAAFDEMLRIIREEEPSKPSTKVSSSQSLPSIAANRRIEPGKLGSMIRGELDWIVLKAMEKDRGRRYETASKFAEDVQHYLNDEAVVACPPSRAYKFRKFARRNKALIGTTAIVAASLIAGIIGTSWQAYRATKAEGIAEERLATVSKQKYEIAEEKTRTEEQAAIAKAVNEFLNEDLLGMADSVEQVENKVVPDPNIRLRVLLDRASKEIDQRFTNQPQVKAAIHHTIGTAYRSIGVLPKAEEHLERAKELRLKELGAYHPDTLSSTHGLAICYVNQDRFSDAEKLFQSTLESQRRILGGEHAKTLISMSGLVGVYLRTGRLNDAERLCAKILEIRRRTLGNEHADTLTNMANLAVVYSNQGQYAAAVTLGRKSLETRKRTLGSEHPSTLVSMNNLAAHLLLAGHHDDAEKLYLETLDVQRRVLGYEHLDTITTMLGLANTHSAQGRYPDAQMLYQKAYEIRQRDLGAEHSDTLSSLTSLAEVFDEQLRFSDAEKLFASALESRRRILGDRHAETLYTMNGLAGNYFHQGRYDEAEELFRTTIELSKETVGEKHPSTLAYVGNLAAVYIKLGRYADAETRYKAILEAERQILGDDHPSTLGTADNLATVLQKRELYDEAEALRRQTLGLRQRTLGNEHPDTLNSKINLAADYCMQRRYQEAENILREVLEIRQRVLGPEHPVTLKSMDNLAIAVQEQGQYVAAERLHSDVLDIRRRVLGSEHPDTLTSIHNLANVMYHQGRKAEAEELNRQTLEALNRVLGPAHESTLETVVNLTAVLSTASNDESVLAAIEQVVDVSLEKTKNEPDQKRVQDLLKMVAGNLANRAWLLTTHADAEQCNPQMAARLTRIASRIQPDTAHHWNNLGVAQYRLGDRQAAVEALEKASEMRGGKDPVYQFVSAMAYWQLDRHEDATKNYVEAAAWLTEKTRNQDQYRFRDEAEDVIAAEDVIQECAARIETEPESGLLYAVRASAFARSGQTEEAAQDYIQALSLLPNLPEFKRRGTYETLLRNPEVFSRVTELRPDDTDLWIARGRDHARHERWRMALEDYEQVIDSYSVDRTLFEYACLLLLNEEDTRYRQLCQGLGKPVLAIEEIGDVVKIRTLHPQAEGEPGRIVEWASEAIQHERNKYRVYQLGLAQLRAGNCQEAIQLLHECHTDLGLEMRKVAFPLALAYHRLGRESESQKWFQNGLAKLEWFRSRGPSALATEERLHIHVFYREAASVLGKGDDPPAKAAPLQNIK